MLAAPLDLYLRNQLCHFLVRHFRIPILDQHLIGHKNTVKLQSKGYLIILTYNVVERFATTSNSYLIHKPSGLGAKNIHITIPYAAIIAPGTTNDRPQSSSTKDPKMLRFVYLYIK